MSKDDGARWWRESLALARLRRRMGPLGLGGASLLGAGCAPVMLRPPPPHVQAAPVEDSVQALTLQRQSGWDVGAEEPLELHGAVDADVLGGDGWRDELDGLFLRLLPARADLLPYYVPTLFQATIGPGNERLRAQLAPVRTAAMDADFARGAALRELFEEAGWPTDIAIIVDVAGPSAVAIAAALSDRFDPVFTFADWPHPRGVVPAQDTLGAVLTYLPLFARGRSERPTNAPPLFVLDANRLADYVDDAAQFDNRYLVRLPAPEQLAALGVRHVMYVNADGAAELADLNEALVALGAHGIDVRTVALADFSRGPTLDASADADWPPADETYWYGGTPEWNVTFWPTYGWYPGSSRVYVGARCHRHPIEVVRWTGPPPPLSPACHRVPTWRATPWNGVVHPTLGRVVVRSTVATHGGGHGGHFVAHGGGGRSGSLGRGGGHSG
jgi:hypothetical protein